MKWEDFVKKPVFRRIEDLVMTNIECPECGEYIFQRTNVVLTSDPPKRQYKCMKCGWIGSR